MTDLREMPATACRWRHGAPSHDDPMDHPNERRAGIAPNGKPYESVWDFPRPPRLELVDWHILAVHAHHVVVDAPSAWRVLETSQPPAYYVSPDHVDTTRLRLTSRRTVCEWKGVATYADLVDDAGRTLVTDAGMDLSGARARIRRTRRALGVLSATDRRVPGRRRTRRAERGRLLRGWITANVTGPFKGGPGTRNW